MVDIIQGLNSGAALVLFVLVLSNPNGFNKRGNILLALFLFCLFIQLFDELLRNKLVFESYPFLGSIGIFFLLTMPVLLYKGIELYINPRKKFSIRDCKYFIVPLLYILVLTCGSITTRSIELFNRDSSDQFISFIYLIFFLLFLSETTFFWIKGHTILIRHHENVAFYSSANEEVNLDWLKKFHYVYLTMILSWFVSSLYFANWMIILANLIFLVGIFLIAYHSMKQKPLFSAIQDEEHKILEFLAHPNTDDQVETSSTNDHHELKEELLILMEQEKPHLENEMNLAKLSDLIEKTPHQVSNLLNSSFSKNFSRFINDYRVQEAQKILLDPSKSKYTMLQIAYESGFNSKTVFNTYFKKSTGVSPSAFKKEKLAALSA